MLHPNIEYPISFFSLKNTLKIRILYQGYTFHKTSESLENPYTSKMIKFVIVSIGEVMKMQLCCFLKFSFSAV